LGTEWEATKKKKKKRTAIDSRNGLDGKEMQPDRAGRKKIFEKKKIPRKENTKKNPCSNGEIFHKSSSDKEKGQPSRLH